MKLSEHSHVVGSQMACVHIHMCFLDHVFSSSRFLSWGRCLLIFFLLGILLHWDFKSAEKEEIQQVLRHVLKSHRGPLVSLLITSSFVWTSVLGADDVWWVRCSPDLYLAEVLMQLLPEPTTRVIDLMGWPFFSKGILGTGLTIGTGWS